MAFLWISIRILLLGYERIAGKKISQGNNELLSSWGFFTTSFIMMAPFFYTLNFEIFKIALISGTIYTMSFFLYVYALSNEDASIIAPLYNMNVIFLIITTSIFLDEKITIFKVVGSLLMLYGVSYLKKDRSLIESYKNIGRSKGAVAMLVSSGLMAIGRTIDGHFVKDISPVGYSVGIYLVVSLYFTILTLIKFKSIKPHLTLIKNKKYDMLAGGFTNAYSYIALLNAFKYIDVSIAEPVSMISSLVTAFFAKYIFNEKVSLRVVGTVILIAGAFIIYM
ncbi:MAG: EamA family transporter [Thermotogota bacterium]